MSTVTTRFSPPKRRPPGRLEQRLGHLGRDVAAEGRPDEIPLAQAVEHLVEGPRELAHLVRGTYRKREGQIAARDPRHPDGECADGPGQTAREEKAQDQRAQRPETRGVEDGAPQLLQPVEVDLHRVVDRDDRRGPSRTIQNGRERGDPRSPRHWCRRACCAPPRPRTSTGADRASSAAPGTRRRARPVHRSPRECAPSARPGRNRRASGWAW